MPQNKFESARSQNPSQPDPQRRGEVKITPVDQEAVRFARESWHQEKFTLNGKEIEIYGLAHIPETFLLFNKEIEEAIKRASIVLREFAPRASGALSPKVELGSTDSFAEDTEWLIGMNGKLLATSDLYPPFDLIDKFDQENMDIENIKNVLGVSVLPIALISVILEMRAFLKGSPKVSISRRAFLAGSLGAAGVGVSAALSSKATSLEETTLDKIGRRDNPLGAFLYNLMDYRNVVVAEGLARLTRSKMVNNTGPIVMFYGDLHRTAVRHYAEHPKERAAKLKAYLPFNNISTPKLKIFKPEQTKDSIGNLTDEIKWQTLEEEDLLR